MTAAGWAAASGWFLFVVTSLILMLALHCNLTLLDREKAANKAANRAEAERDNAKADAALLRKSNKGLSASNARLRRHTAEHCRQHAEMTAWLASKGWVVGESAPGEPSLLDEADLAAVESPEDIAWFFPEQRKGGES